MQSIRIDKYLSQLWLVSRRDAKKFFRAGNVQVNGYVEYDHGFQVIDGDMIEISTGDELSQPSQWQGDRIIVEVRQSVTVLLNKPAGYVCSEIDEAWHKSYKYLLQDCIYSPLLKVAWRLDYDTTGLVIATSDGQLNHTIISPRLHKEKEYIVTCKDAISDKNLSDLACWVVLEDGYTTLPAKTVRIDTFSFHLTIVEWKYHQIKRMCEAIGNTVVQLQRIRIGEWKLDELAEWQWRYI